MKKELLVIKIGASLLQKENKIIDENFIRDILIQIAKIKKNWQVVLITSGAIAAGMNFLGLKERPKEMVELQVLASIGQPHLISLYQKSVDSMFLIGQILLTYEDLDSLKRRENLKNTINGLLKKEALPVINENDSTAIEEIRFGDNDKLSALVAELIRARLLVLLTDVEGLYDSENKIIPVVKKITPEIKNLAGKAKSEITTGGMISKIIATEIATKAGITTIIANGRRKDVLLQILKGEDVGTKFLSKNE